MRVLQQGNQIMVAAGFAALGLPGRVVAQQADAAALARELSNPIASLVSVPFQQNWEQGVGLKSGVSFTLQSESTANWEADGGEEWTVPLNVLVTKVVKLGQRPMQVVLLFPR